MGKWVRYLLINSNELPIVKGCNYDKIQTMLSELFGKEDAVLNHEAIHLGQNENTVWIGFNEKSSLNKHENRLLYFNSKRTSVGGVICGSFVILGYVNGDYVSLSIDQITTFKRLYGKRSIEDMKKAL